MTWYDNVNIIQAWLLLPELPKDCQPVEVHDALIELLYIEGEQLFSYTWDSGAPGAGSGTESVHRLRGRFFYDSSDFGVGGPFDSMPEALRHVVPLSNTGKILVSPITTDISCPSWTIRELIEYLDLQECDPQCVLVLNGEVWHCESLKSEQQRMRGMPH